MKQFLTALMAWVLIPAFLTAGNASPAADKQAYVSEVKLIGGNADEVRQLKASSQKQGWTVIENNLNAGTRGDVIYLCYKTTNDDAKAITDLYLSSNSNPVARSLTVKGRSYTLCPCEGGNHFTEIRGDLNSNCGGDDIHLFYTKAGFDDGRVVTEIWFNASQKGAVCKDGTSTPYDLNKGAGGDDIFLHFTTR